MRRATVNAFILAGLIFGDFGIERGILQEFILAVKTIYV